MNFLMQQPFIRIISNAAIVRAGEVQRQIASRHLSQKTHDIGNASYAIYLSLYTENVNRSSDQRLTDGILHVLILPSRATKAEIGKAEEKINIYHLYSALYHLVVR